MRHFSGPVLLLILLTACGKADRKEQLAAPNILLILADDLGYADLGCYGSDLNTPNIDALATDGIRFSRFHAAPKCAPSRAMLLSGNDNHIAGMGMQSTITREPGYEGAISSRVLIIPEILGAAGYHCSMAGKWHLGKAIACNPAARGFHRSFVLLEGAGNHYSSKGIFATSPQSPYTEDGREVSYPGGRYATSLYTEKLITFMEEAREEGKPFFCFAAYTSPHWPLQVDSSWWKPYEGSFDMGYEALRKKRLQSLIDAGMIPEGTPLPPLHPDVPPWNSLSSGQQKRECRKMELYAGMVSNLDHHVGLLTDYLKTSGQFENTYVLFMSDNGAAPEDFYMHDHYGPYIRANYDSAYAQMGSPNSFVSYGPQWAEAGTAPFRYFKTYATEGGMLAPLIISGPGIAPRQDPEHGWISLLDLAPSFYDMAGAHYPDTGKYAAHPLRGRSMLPFLRGESDRIHGSADIFSVEHGGQAMLRKGDWKILSLSNPLEAEGFELYNVTNDPGEIHNLRDSLPGLFFTLWDSWTEIAEDTWVQPRDSVLARQL